MVTSLMFFDSYTQLNPMAAPELIAPSRRGSLLGSFQMPKESTYGKMDGRRGSCVLIQRETLGETNL